MKKINAILDNVEPQLQGEYRFGDEERQELEKHLERSFLRDTKKDNNESHDFSIDIPPKDNRESTPMQLVNYSAHQEDQNVRPFNSVNNYNTFNNITSDSGIMGLKPKALISETDTLTTEEDVKDDIAALKKKQGATSSRNTDRPYEKQLLVRIISTWGDINQAGLTKIQLFDEDGSMLLLGPYDFFIKNAGNLSINTLERLIEGSPYTTQESEMWTCQMPAPPTTPELYINTKRHNIGALRIWNYNKSLIDSVKGIKEVEIVNDDQLVWTGILNRAPGNDYEEYVTEILLVSDIYLPDLQTPQRPITKANEINSLGSEGAISYRHERKDAPIMNQDRPISVPAWGSNISVQKFVSAEEVLTPSSTISHEPKHDRSLPLKGMLIKPREDHSKTIDAKTSGYDSHDNETKSKKDDMIKTKSAAKIKHPKVRDPIPIKKGEPTPALSSPFKSQKETSNPDLQGSKKKDSNNSINSLEYFNITNFGRLKPARRESLQEVLSLKQDVEERIHNIEKLLDFKSTPITEAELMSHLSKKTVSKQLNIIDESQELEQPAVSFKQALAEIEKIDITEPSPSTTITSQSKPETTTKNSNIPSYFEKSVKIPELPTGKKLKFLIYSTWGDTYYLGLSGIEIFDEKGLPILIKSVKEQVVADPTDINSLPGYGQDPRTIDKLFDGTYLTCDDLHVWLAPFTKGKEHYIEIDMKGSKTISMIRIWNYNKSRIHSYRGVRDVSILLDGAAIFTGEIAKAPGSLKGAEDCCEYIMFTTKEDIISKIEKEDWLNKISRQDIKMLELSTNAERPLTGTRRFDDGELGEKSFKEEERPLTTAKLAQTNQLKLEDDILLGSSDQGSPEQGKGMKPFEAKSEYKFKSTEKPKTSSGQIKCRKLLFNILDTWGDPFYVGLTGLEVLDQEEKPIPIKEDYLTAKPKDMNSIPGYSGDYRTLDKLINGITKTVDDQNMWMIPFTKGQPHLITIHFPEEKTITGIRFWNYNKSYEHSSRGVRMITISADNILVTPSTGVMIKKSSGSEFFDFGQLLRLPFQDAWSQSTVKMYQELKPKPMNGFLIQDFDTPELPTGFTFKIVIYESWGDMDYVGLNGIEFYDHNGAPLLQSRKIDFTIAAEPGSINVLKGSGVDERTVDKLVNGENDTIDDRNMWLSPFLNERRDGLLYKTKNNEIVITFDKPVLLSCAKFWNYTKTLSRGAKEIEIHCDDALIYRKGATPEDIKKGMDWFSSVLFTKNGKLIEKIKSSIYTENGEPQKVVLVNEKKVMNKVPKGNSSQTVALERPSTSVRGKD